MIEVSTQTNPEPIVQKKESKTASIQTTDDPLPRALKENEAQK